MIMPKSLQRLSGDCIKEENVMANNINVKERKSTISTQDGGVNIFKTTAAPYMRVGFRKGKINIIPADKPSEARPTEILFKTKQNRVRVGPAFLNAYNPGVYERIKNGKDGDTIICKGAGISRPASINYAPKIRIDKSDFEELFTEKFNISRMKFLIRATGVGENDEVYVTTVMTNKQHFLLIDTVEKPEVYDSVNDITGLYGLSAKGFPTGSFVCGMPLSQLFISKAWIDAAGTDKFKFLKFGGKFLLIPVTEETCMVDNKEFDPTKHYGKDSSLCPECHDSNIVDVARDVLAKAGKRIVELEEENRELRRRLKLL